MREVGILGQESVAGVHRVGAGLLARLDELVDDEVGVGGRRATEREGLVGDPDVQGVAVRIGVDRDRGVAGVPTGPDHSDRDLATIGYEHLLHCCAPFARVCRFFRRLPGTRGGPDTAAGGVTNARPDTPELVSISRCNRLR